MSSEKEDEKKQIALDSITNPFGNMIGIQVSSLSNSKLSPMGLAQFNQNTQQQDGYSQLGDELSAGANAINSNEYMSQKEKNDALLSLHQQYLEAKRL